MHSATEPQGQTSGPPDRSAWHWFAVGIRHALTLPGLILAISFMGFAAFALQAGLPLEQTVFMAVMVWALPAKVVLVGAILAGNGLPAAFLAVTLSSVRLMPMVVALVPEIRGPNTRRLTLYALSHFVAVTSWVLAMQRAREVPANWRTTYFAGLSLTLLVGMVAVVVVTYLLAADLPPIASAALLLLTPVYFLTSLWGSARERAAHVAMVLGLFIGPAIHAVWPDGSLLATGAIGGGAAYGWHRWKGRGSKA